MHSSIFHLPLHLALLSSTTIRAFPFSHTPNFLDAISLHTPPLPPYQNQHPLITPHAPPKDPHIRGTIHMQSALYPHVPTAFAITLIGKSSPAGEMSELVASLADQLLYQRLYGIELRPDDVVEVVSIGIRGEEGELRVEFALLPGRHEEAERDWGEDEIWRIGGGELGFMVRLFVKAIEDLEGVLREEERGIGSVRLEAEVDGVGIRCEFVRFREEDEGC